MRFPRPTIVVLLAIGLALGSNWPGSDDGARAAYNVFDPIAGTVRSVDIDVDTTVSTNLNGTHDGANNAATLLDSTADFIAAGVTAGGPWPDTVANTTDGSGCVITGVAATTVSCTLSGGTENDWDNGDAYTVTIINDDNTPTSVSSVETAISVPMPVYPAASIVSSSVSFQSVITTAAAHGLTTGNWVLIAGHSGSTPDINGRHLVTVISSTKFSIPLRVTVGGTGGTATKQTTHVVDIVVDEIPPVDPIAVTQGITSFNGDLFYDETVVSVIGLSYNWLMAAGGNYSESGANDLLPDSDGAFRFDRGDTSQTIEDGEGVLVRITLGCLAQDTTALSLGDQFGPPQPDILDAQSGIYPINNVNTAEISCGEAAPTPTPTATPTPGAAVGGLADFPDIYESPLDAPDSSGGSSFPYAPLAIALTAALAALAAGGWYARRRWVR